MGIFNFLTLLSKNAHPIKHKKHSMSENLTYAEKELIIVQRVTKKDMIQFEKMPFDLNYPVKKFVADHAHPFAYIDLVGQNVSVAASELNRINEHLERDCLLSPSLPHGLSIPVDEIIFTPSKEHSYTRLICTPHTFNGTISALPLSLVFMTDLTELTQQKDTTHGTLFYDPGGIVTKAEIFFWRGCNGYFFYYDTLDQSFVLSKVELSTANSSYHAPVTIYRDEYWFKQEKARAQEAEDFEWLQSHIPEKCPKSISGFRRMKHANTKNFQMLVSEARKLGRDIR